MDVDEALCPIANHFYARQSVDSTSSPTRKVEAASPDTSDDGDVQAAQDSGLNAWRWILIALGILSLGYYGYTKREWLNK